MGTLRRKAKLLRYSRVGNRNSNKPEVREECLLEEHTSVSVADLLKQSRATSLINLSHQQPVRPSSLCISSPATALSGSLRNIAGGTGLTKLVDSSDWPSQESVTDSPCEEQNISNSTDEMDQVLRWRDTQTPSSESFAEVTRVHVLDLSVGLIITGGRKFSAFYGHHLPRLCYTNLFVFDSFGELSTSLWFFSPFVFHKLMVKLFLLECITFACFFCRFHCFGMLSTL